MFAFDSGAMMNRCFQTGQPCDRIRPRIEPVPRKIGLVEDRCGNRVRIDAETPEHGLEILPVEHIQTNELPVTVADPLHRRLIFGPPSVGELKRNEIGNMIAQLHGHLGGHTAAPVDDGAEHVEDEGLDRIECCCHGYTVVRVDRTVHVGSPAHHVSPSA
jgi:hypothetical protein